MNQNEIYTKILKETESLPLFNSNNQKLPILESLKIFPQCNSKNIYKFKTSKRGRKNKDNPDNNKPKEENIINSLLQKKVVHNKFCNDNVRRRIKALFNKYIIVLLNNLMKIKYKKSKLHFVKMEIRVTKDIGIEYNRILLESTIKEIITKVSNKYQNSDNNKNCIKFIEAQEDNEEILNILNTTYKDLYTDWYLKSTKENSLDNSFEAHKENILNSDGKDYLNIFVKNAENFVKFFTDGKKRKSRRIKEIDTIDIPIGNEVIETADSTNEKNECNIKDKKSIKKYKVEMVSEETQTDLCDINAKLIAFL